MVSCYRHAGREANIRCQRCSRPICPDCMRDAAVGFQCPECVKQGAKTTRSGRATYGGARSSNPALTSQVLIAINAVLWLAVVLTDGAKSALVDLLALHPTGSCDLGNVTYVAITDAQCVGENGTFYAGVADGGYWQLLTSAFMHVQLWHIVGNMLALFVLGPQIEAALGRSRFLALYLGSGLVGSTVVYWASNEFGYTLGASGAIYGLFAALVVLVHKNGGDLRSLAGLFAINLLITFAVPNVSWQGHLGGFVGGLLITGLVVYSPRGPRRSTVQWLGFGGLMALTALAVILRTAALT